MSEILVTVMNLFGIEFLPVAIPLFIYWFYRSQKLNNKLEGKVVFITGASSGLGEAIAHDFYKAGCKVILSARRVEELERVKADLLRIKTDKKTYEPVVFPLDISKVETIPQKALEALEIYNEINILINNAGISYRGNILDTSLDVHMNVMRVNYFGQVALTNALLPSVISVRGHVVAISSIQGRIAIPFRSAYAASKHALQAYMDCLRSEQSEIKVTVINPGYVRTNISVNAITATGETYGVLDSTTAKGYSPEYVAQEILRAVIMESKEVNIAPLPPKIAIIIRSLFPSLFFYIVKRMREKK